MRRAAFPRSLAPTLSRSPAVIVLRDFIWADLRGGLLDIRGLSLVTQGVVLLGFGLLFAMLWALLNNDVWRTESPLLALANGVPRRGTLLPEAVVPATLFLLAIAWSFALAGALHSHPLFRVATLYFYLMIGTNWTDLSGTAELGWTLAAWALLLAVPVLFAVRWRAKARPGLEFALLFGLVAATFAMFHQQGVATWRVTGVPLVLGDLGDDVLSFTLLIIPLLMLAGSGMAEFALRAADWGVAAADRLPAWLPRALLGAVILWRLREVGLDAAERLAGAALPGALLPFAGGLVVPLAVWAAWGVLRLGQFRSGRARPDLEQLLANVTGAWMPLILAYTSVHLLVFLVSQSVLIVAILSLGQAPRILSLVQWIVDTFNNLRFLTAWHIAVDLAAIGLGAWLARRRRTELGLYLAIFGLVDIFRELAQPGRVFSPLVDPDFHLLVDFWWVLIFSAAAGFWLVRGELTRARVSRLLLAVLLTALARQTDFLSNRFSVFGFAGVGFLAFGLAWDALTIGSWANVESRALPRTSRIFFYLGYVLLTVAVVNWALATHDLAAQARLTGDMALSGFNRFGRPVLYAVFAVVLAAGAHRRAGVAVPGEGEELEPARKLHTSQR